MPTILYKRLIEVRLLHEYYLIKGDGSNFFVLSPQARRAYLRTQILSGNYNLLNDLTIEPTETTQQLLQQYKLKFSATYTGCVIGIEVHKYLSETDQTISFRPKTVLPNDLVFEFIILPKNPLFRNFTNTRLQTFAPAIYVLDSADTRNVFPNLSVPVADFTDQNSYETGELAAFMENGARVVKQALQTTKVDDPADWQIVTPTQGFLNESDRRLLPKRFYVNLSGTQKQSIDAQLSRPTGEVVGKVVQEAKERAWLDFSRINKTTIKLPDGAYQLTINGPDGLLMNQLVYLSDSYNPTAFALIRLHHQDDLGDFSLLQNGALKYNASTTEDPQLIFEIWLQSRLTYWRYSAKTQKGLTLEPPLGNLLTLSADKQYVETKKPYSLRFKQTTTQNLDVPLPNPSPVLIKQTGSPRFYTYVDTPIHKIALYDQSKPIIFL
ncbi:hypothetical protein [Spirosoma panaciterrae]|uniref:hypothetical protein n=1 Tax=Spirosoma panaciterrae TaxID=496058 RepID=UPI0003760AC2|nr:hypothetical protein [Spirosoma panaciterrae]